MRPRRVRLGYPSESMPTGLFYGSFNEAEARPPRIHPAIRSLLPRSLRSFNEAEARPPRIHRFAVIIAVVALTGFNEAEARPPRIRARPILVSPGFGSLQ